MLTTDHLSWDDEPDEKAFPMATPLTAVWLGLTLALARAGKAVGLHPNTVTGFRLVLSVGVVLLVTARGDWPMLAAFLVVVSAVADSVDGALASMTGQDSRLGQVYDGLADRLSEACWLMAFALLGAQAWLVAACGGLAWIQDYLRVKALGTGMPRLGIVTVGERPTRTLIVAVALFLVGAGGWISSDLPVGIVTAASAIWALLQAAALLQLFAAVRYALINQN